MDPCSVKRKTAHRVYHHHSTSGVGAVDTGSVRLHNARAVLSLWLDKPRNSPSTYQVEVNFSCQKLSILSLGSTWLIYTPILLFRIIKRKLFE